ncbi:MAG: cytosine permease [Methanobrevibacter sp.]|uniref:cytosine permease n=1 Tax=Methanobrevibacter sp. TaxID=66852 RepID=UPI0025F0808F|nr:cytosine permease [Methanobrevibacter sp.]MBQ6098683.1 cytosine permease [Methanobrevibacter sp.]
MENRTGIFTNGIIWFGVAISVSEIEAGIQIGTLSSLNSLWFPLILGHLLGGIMLFLVGYIGASVRKNAMETTESTFGRYGSKFFASLNVLQLVAWVAVLNAQGASALAGLDPQISFPLICMLFAIFIAIWVYVGLQRSSKVTAIVMMVLTILLAILTVRLYGFDASGIISAGNANSKVLDFWNIFEISIAMPISWLPVISDYTKDVEKPINATAVSAAAYTIASLWMYFIGIEIAGMGLNNVAQAILLANLGIPGVIIMVLSTITTNFLAANSAGESAKAIFHKLNPKIVGVIVSFISAVIAILGIMGHYISFLYLVASVFAPMAAVLAVSFYLNMDDECISKWNMFAWLAGFITYQLAIYQDSVFLGPTLLAIIVSAAITYIGKFLKKRV